MTAQRGTSPASEWAQGEARFRALLQHSSDIITVLAADGTVLYNTPAVARVLGYQPEELTGKVALDFIHPDDLATVGARLAEALAMPGTPVPVEFRFRHRDGRWIPLDAVGINYLDDGSVRGVVVNSRDASERRSAEQAYRTIVDDSLQGLAILQHGRVVFANQALADMTGYSIEDLKAMDPPQVRRTSHPDDVQRISQQWRARRSGLDVPPRAEFRIVRKDGGICWVETYASPIEYHGEPATHVAYVDVTERHRADEEKTALLQIAGDLSGAFDRKTITDRVLERTFALVPLDQLFIAYWDSQRQVYRAVAGVGNSGAPAGSAGDEVVFPPDHPIVAELTQGRPVVVNDIESQPWLAPQMLRDFRIRALLIAPLFVRGRASGALVAVRRERRQSFRDDEVRLFVGIARQLALGFDAADRHEAEQQEAAISAALANVGREMIGSLSRPNLLETLCEITTRALECDRSHTFLIERPEGHLASKASFGFSREEWEALRVVRFPIQLAHDLIARLQREEAVAVYAGDEMFPGPMLQEVGTPAVLFMALRRGEELLGIHSAVMTAPGRRFSEKQFRIARGIAQLASLSIEDARLVAELERANRLKSEFVATMSHELRTPLNIILGYNGLMLEDAFGPLTEEQRDTLSRVETNAKSLLELINTTLDMSRLEAGEIRLDLGEVHVHDLLEEIRRETHELELKREVRFHWEPVPKLPALHTDAAKLKVVLKNLVGNAVKFTDRGSITVGARPHADGVQFHVADTGIGIEDQALSIIFEAFRQVDAALTRRHGGVGLGLYIVRRLLGELGGSVEVESAVGQGSTFRVWLPWAQAQRLAFGG